MKKIIFPLLFFPFLATAQSALQLDSTHYFVWDTNNDTYNLNKRGFYTTDANNNITIQEYLVEDGIGGWKNSEKDIFIFDSDQNRTEWLRQVGDGSGWKNDWRWTYSYTANNDEEIKIVETWNGSTWENQSQSWSFYDANNRKYEQVISFWINNMWMPTNRYFYTYNFDNLEDTIYLETYNPTTFVWQVASQQIFTYDADKNPIIELRRQMWPPPVLWENSVKIISTFDSYNRATNTLTQVWQNNQWNDNQRINNEWHSSGEKAIISWARKVFSNPPNWTNADSMYHFLSSKVGVNDINTKVDFTIYPNPSNGIIYLKADDLKSVSNIKLLNILGQIVCTETLYSTNVAIDLSSYPKGSYILQFTTEKGTINKKIILQ